MRAAIANNASVIEAIDTNDHGDFSWALGGSGPGNFCTAASLNTETVPLLSPKENKKN